MTRPRILAGRTPASYWAIQAKCYSNTLSDKDVSTFFMASMADTRYRHFIIADTAPAISLARVADHARLGRQGLPMSMQPTQI